MARQRRPRLKKVRRDALERRIAATVCRLLQHEAFRAIDGDALGRHVLAVREGARKGELWRGLLVLVLIAAHRLRRADGPGLPDGAGIAIPWEALSAIASGWCRFSWRLAGDPDRLTLGQTFATEPAPSLWRRRRREPQLASPPDAIAEDAVRVCEEQGWTAGPECLARGLDGLYARAIANRKRGASWKALEVLALVAAAHSRRDPPPAPDAIVYAPWWSVLKAGGVFLDYVHGLSEKSERVTLGQAYHVEAPPAGRRGRRLDTSFADERQEGRKRDLLILLAARGALKGGKTYVEVEQVAKHYGLSERTVWKALTAYGAATVVQVPGRKR